MARNVIGNSRTMDFRLDVIRIMMLVGPELDEHVCQHGT